MATLHETEVDGVRCFWVETGRPTLAAHLTFRFGMADERLPTAGWQHLLEHLALHGRGGGSLHVNGSVGLLSTSFDTHGPPEAVTAHLRDLTGWLHRPDLSELERERNVLRAEASARGGSTSGRALTWRYGARGPGLVEYPVTAIGRASAELLAERAAHTFGRGNAVLALDGPPPPDLRLDLPDGALLPVVRAEPCGDRLPAAYAEPGGLTLSGVVSREAGAIYVPMVIQHALTDRLRTVEAGAYAPWATYEPVDADHAVVLAGSDHLPHVRERAVDAVLEIVRALEAHGPDEGVLADLVAGREQALRDPYAVFQLALNAARLTLAGQHAWSLDETLERGRVDVPDVQQGCAELARSLLLGVPDTVGWRSQLPTLSMPVHEPRASGVRLRSRDWPADGSILVLGTDRIEVTDRGVASGAELREIVGVLAYPDGARVLVRHDGYQVAIDPEAWRRGSDAVAFVDRHVPAERHLPQAPRDLSARPRTGIARRWWRGLLRARTTRSGVTVIAVVLALVLGLGILVGTGHPYGLGGLVAGLVVGLRALWSDRSPAGP